MDLSLKQIVDELVARLADGPMQFRFILQPLMSTTLGIWDGAKDAKAGLPPFLWGLISVSKTRRAHFKSALWRLRIPILIAASLDAVAQYIMFGYVRPLSALFVGSLLMVLPYSSARGLANRFRSRLLAQRTKAAAAGSAGRRL
jgi:hypothetical protein